MALTLTTLDSNLESLVTAHGDLVKRVNTLATGIEAILAILDSPAGSPVTATQGKTPANGKVVKTKSKKASKVTRKDAEASNSAKYVCDCIAKTTGKLAWGVREEFKTKHVAKGHTVTQVRD